MDHRIARDVTGARLTSTRNARHQTSRHRWPVRILLVLFGLFVVICGAAVIHNGGIFDLVFGAVILFSGLGFVRSGL